MRKLFTSVCVLCAALLCLTSCNLSKERQYEFLYEVQATLANDEDWKTLEEYLKESFIGTKKYSFYATYTDTYSQAVEIYDQDIKTIDEDVILDAINDPDDIIYVYGVITGDKVRDHIKVNYWNYEYKQMKRPDTPDPEE